MREIKFRGLSGKDKWTYGDLIQTTPSKADGHVSTWIKPINILGLGVISTPTDNFIKVIPESAGQFTGLKDRNGADIYEGDIVKITRYVGGDFMESSCSIKRVCWSRFGWALQPIGRDISHPEMLCISDSEELEVIGNIHENP